MTRVYSSCFFMMGIPHRQLITDLSYLIYSLYSCLDGFEDEDKDESLDLVINFKTQQFGKHLKFKSSIGTQQYILIKK
ncbi:hypothetical protein C2U27_14035 [Bacillus aerophilus]|nr:hypothetical protein [Bacillus aerophilus]